MEVPITLATAPTEDSGLLHFACSSGHVDRMGDVIVQSFDLDGFKRNPVMPWSHRHSDPPIGIWPKIKVVGAGKEKRLEGWAKFVPREIYPFAGLVEDQYRAGFLSAVSVGVRPLERKILSPEQKQELGMDPYGMLITHSELLEVSAVAVPANRDALIQRGLMTEEAARDLEAGSLELMRKGVRLEEIEEWARSELPAVPQATTLPTTLETVHRIIVEGGADIRDLVALLRELRADRPKGWMPSATATEPIIDDEESELDALLGPVLEKCERELAAAGGI